MKLSLFARTFLLTGAALVVAVGVGVTLLVTRPPIHNAPVRLSDIAWQLSAPPGQHPPGTREFAPPGDTLGDTSRPPPPARGMDMRGPPPGGGRREWQLRDSKSAPPTPSGVDAATSEHLRRLLAARLGAGVDRVRVYVREPLPLPMRSMSSADPELREGFIAASQLDSGDWRIMESVVEGFPNAFQRQTLWLVLIGLLVLLPGSWWFASTLSSPIRRFSEGARRLGTDPHAPPLERKGTPEMIDAIDSFNAMQGRIARLLQERSQMIGAIAHDLRTPLMRLAFRLDALESPLKEKAEADIGEMKLMISAALDFLRDQAATGSRERLNLRPLIESVVDDHADLGYDVTLGSGEPALLRGDPVALRRMMANLVDNALKYGERARLRLGTDGDQVTIEIDDDGPGIPEALQQRVFEPFFRGESSRNRETGGIGLGLATVRAIVLDHGGHIELRNRKDGGLRVVASLPIT